MVDPWVPVFKSPHAPKLEDQSTPRRLGPAPLTVKWRRLQSGERVVAATAGQLERWSLATVDSGRWHEQVSFDPMIVLVPFICYESRRNSKHAF